LLSGQAVFISGLEEVNDTNTEQKVPGIGDIPLIGRLFHNHERQRTTTQLFIILTASMTDAGDLEIAPMDPNPSYPPRSGGVPLQKALPPPPPIVETYPPLPLPAATPRPKP
jgi:general secretion pathway protein D